MIYNVLSVNVDVADPGFKFFWYAPMWHAAELVRFEMFGTLASRVPMHVGVLFLWLGVELPLFFAVHVRVAAREAARKLAAPPAPGPAPGVEV